MVTERARARHNAKIGAKTSWFLKKKKEEEEYGGSELQEGQEPRKALKLSRKDTTAKKTRNAQKKDDREVDGVIFISYTTASKLRIRNLNKDDKLTIYQQTCNTY